MKPGAAPIVAPDAMLNESQRRSLSAGIRRIAGLLDEAESVLATAGKRSPLSRFIGDVRPADAGVVRDFVERIRRTLLAAARRHELDVRGQVVDVWHAVDVDLVFASIAVEEMRSKRLRGYGAVGPEVAQEVDRTCDDLDRAIREMQLFVIGGAEEDHEARLKRLGDTVSDPELLRTLERVIREHGLVEFRALMRSVLERVEERSFHIAVFGRVSSGKSSLLNALIGADVLPVGVTPVTAVPTRIRVGRPPSLEVRYATGGSEILGIDALRSLASEEGNPGNQRHVSRLTVVYPVPGLPEGVDLVDTPGIGSLATSGAAEAIAYLPRTDLALLLVDVGSSIGTDELGLLRLFKDAAIPVEIVLSKADLVSDESREKLARYVRQTVEREVGLVPEVSAVSAIETERALVRAFAERRLAPRFEERRELVAVSIRRLSGRLLEGVIGTLRLRLGRGGTRSSPSDVTARVRDADGRIAEARSKLERIASSLEEALGLVLEKAAGELIEAWRRGGARRIDAAPAMRDALGAEAGRLRDESLAELAALRASLRDMAKEIEAAAGDLASVRMQGPDLSGLPVLDPAAVIPTGTTCTRPLLLEAFPARAIGRVARALARTAGLVLRETLRSHGYRLRDFSVKAVEKLAEGFHGSVSPFLAASDSKVSEAESEDRPATERDLAVLESLKMRREETPA